MVLRRASWLAALALISSVFVPTAFAAPAGNHEVYLYVSPATKGHFPGVGGNYDAMINPWRKFLSTKKIAVRELYGPAELAGLKGGVLIVPSAVALSDAARRALLRFRDAGGSLLATWAIGSRDAQGEWLGYDFARELLGVTVTGEIEAESQSRYLIPYGDSPVSHSVPAGKRIWLGQLSDKPLRLKGGQEAGAYTDWARKVSAAGDHHSAIVFDESGKGGRPGGGRWVMFGFPETSWSFQPGDIYDIAADAISWLRRMPDAHLAAWPSGYRAAQIIEMDTEDGFANAARFARLMESIDAASTFYCLTSVALKHRELVKDIARKHEIGYHGEVHTGFKDLPRAEQDKRLDRMLADMKDIFGKTGGAGTGFRAPMESYDATTEALLQVKGLRHHTADPNSSQVRLPFFSTAATPDLASSLVVLPRGQLDDLNYQNDKLTPEEVATSLIAEYEFNILMGGLGLMSIHSQNFADPDKPAAPRENSLMSRAFPELIRHIGARREKAWLAPAGKVAEWWRERSRATVVARKSGKQLQIDLAVSGAEPVNGLAVLVSHPAGDAAPIIRPVSGKSPVPVVRSLDRFTSALVFATAAPGQYAYQLSFP